MVVKTITKDKSLAHNSLKSRGLENDHLTETFLWLGMRSAQEQLREEDKNSFLYTDWLRLMNIDTRSTTTYTTGKTGNRIATFQRMVRSAAKLNKRFSNLFFENIFRDFFPGLNIVKAFETMLFYANAKDEPVDAEQLGDVLDHNLSTQAKIQIARKLLLSANKSSSYGNDDSSVFY